ncbi:FAD-binding oxidoreductase [Yinghuangia seranimata]|uniref:FAD-binding oxidoreductase n=1 Tax=Yinghuangia seranimata TaxID=408067 RepID=UPI00248BDF5C|nr:FAD-binding oxidoreductase [Yinghuangia seranimata]MDI2125925.1 FAD-binding oxidoreductase [Yinghuangia seranimata]
MSGYAVPRLPLLSPPLGASVPEPAGDPVRADDSAGAAGPAGALDVAPVCAAAASPTPDGFGAPRWEVSDGSFTGPGFQPVPGSDPDLPAGPDGATGASYGSSYGSSYTPPPTGSYTTADPDPSLPPPPPPPPPQDTLPPRPAAPVDPLGPRLIQESLAVVAPRADAVLSHFYALLFIERPDLRSMFPPMMDAQRDRLLAALLRLGASAGDPESQRGFLRQLGRDHRKYGVLAEHYAAVGVALIGALARFSRDRWNEATQEAWLGLYSWASRVMIEAAEEDAMVSPPWWDARIIVHERRGPDIAILTVAPDRPLPYRPGQHVTVETPWWPRVWRHYSIANAPRPDNLLELHVRAVPAGWVSQALVHRARVGDHLRLGPARGALVMRGESLRRALCVAGGTGLAPIKALVEHMAQRQLAHDAHVFIGARRTSELYDLRALSQMAEMYSWLHVVPAVSEDLSFSGARGTLPDVLARYGDWRDHDVYISGSSAMVSATRLRLTGELGVEPGRLLTESLDAVSQGDRLLEAR